MPVVIDADPKSVASVTLDGQSIGPAAYATTIPVDPGPHVVRARAPGATPFEQVFRVSEDGSVTKVHVPSFEPAPEGAPQPTRAPPAPTATNERSGRHTTLALVAGGSGVALIAVGAYFGVHALSDRSTADNECNATFCTQAGLDAIRSMKTSEALSTISIGTGLATVGVGGAACAPQCSAGSNQVVLCDPLDKASLADCAAMDAGCRALPQTPFNYFSCF